MREECPIATTDAIGSRAIALKGRRAWPEDLLFPQCHVVVEQEGESLEGDGERFSVDFRGRCTPGLHERADFVIDRVELCMLSFDKADDGARMAMAVLVMAG